MSGAEVDPNSSGFDVGAFDAYLRDRTESDLFAGVVRVDHQPSGGPHTVLLEQGYGLASRAWGVPCTPDIRFDTASVTKLFTAVATLQLVDAGAFGLDTSVTEYLELRGTPISSKATPYHMLTHSSGIADDADEEAGERYEDLFIDTPNYSFRETKDLLAGFIDKPPNFAPGEGTRYNNAGYLLLGLMIERATGMSYREYVRQQVFEKAGMTGAVFASSDIVTPRIAEGADPIRHEAGTVTAWKRNIFSYPPTGSPDGGAHVTAADLVAFHDALQDGALLSDELTAEMLKPHELYRTRKVGAQYTGYGFMFSTDAAGEVETYWKEGINVGASGILSRYPRSALTLVILSSMEDGAWEPLAEVDRMLGVNTPDPDTID
ncbi:MAG TPA: serine hydrolase domain-containing protein [Actinomycetes bacterium]|nr:serine hydrolase domain-containing protein [Actinomycetes bacterium]